MKNNKKQGRCPFSPLTLLAALLLIGGMLAIILPVLQWDAEGARKRANMGSFGRSISRQKHVKWWKKKRRISTLRRRFR